MTIKLLKLLTGLTMIVLILLTSLNLSAFNYRWYQKQFVRQPTTEQFDQDRLERQTKNLFAYLKNQEILEPEYYTTREILHLRDVKNIITSFRITNLILLALLGGLLTTIYSRLGKKELWQTLLLGSLAALIFYVLLTTVVIFQFDNFFLWLHQISFTNDFWQLNPNVDNLINVFPPTLFFALGQIIIIKSALTALVGTIVSLIFLKRLN